MGELARRVGQPEVLGELTAGFLLGPSVFGALLPSGHTWLFGSLTAQNILSGMSWVGAILLLLMAGLEVDLTILRQVARPGAFAAALAIIPSIVAGSLFAAIVIGRTPPAGIFLGVVLSVTGVSVAAKILMERDLMRRQFAQVILAVGVASEVLVWLFVAVMSSLKSSSPLLAGALHTAYAVGFFIVMMTVGRRFTFWTMRRVGDFTGIARGQESLVLALTFVAAAVTEALGLHALLGAFVFGVLLSAAPRKNERLLASLQALTLGLFGPIFFTLAGMRVDILQLTTLSSVGMVLLLLVVATVVKVAFTTLGARLGGQPGWESVLIGVGVNLKGGTDVIVAVVGTELGLLTVRTYTMYAIVAILTVFISPPLIRYLEGKAPPSTAEQERLESEEASRRSYVPKLERVLVPVSKELLGSLAASVVERVAHSKHEQGQILDIVELEVQRNSRDSHSRRAREARERLGEAGNLKTVELREQSVDEKDVVASILKASTDFDLIAIGAKPPRTASPLSFGDIADDIIDGADADVLVAVDHTARTFDCASVNSVLVPTNGLEYSMAAGDIAGALAHACNARMVLLHVVKPSDGSDEEAVESASAVLDELAFRIGRLGVEVEKRTEVSTDQADVILKELSSREHNLVVMGGRDRGRDGKLYLGMTIGTVLTRALVPAVLVVSHGTQ